MIVFETQHLLFLILGTESNQNLRQIKAHQQEIVDRKSTTNNEDDIALLNGIFSYARENIALVNIYIKPPVVTKILRDQRTPIIWYAILEQNLLNRMTTTIIIMFVRSWYPRQLIFDLFSGLQPIVEVYWGFAWDFLL